MKRRCHLSERKVITIPDPPSDHPLAWLDQVCLFDLHREQVSDSHIPAQGCLKNWTRSHANNFGTLLTQWRLSDLRLPRTNLNPDFLEAWDERINAAYTVCNLSLWRLEGIERLYSNLEPDFKGYKEQLIPLQPVSFSISGLTDTETDTACELIYLLSQFVSMIYPTSRIDTSGFPALFDEVAFAKQYGHIRSSDPQLYVSLLNSQRPNIPQYFSSLSSDEIGDRIEDIKALGRPNLRDHNLNYIQHILEASYKGGQVNPTLDFDSYNKETQKELYLGATGKRGLEDSQKNQKNQNAKIVKLGLEAYLTDRPELFDGRTFIELQTHLTTSLEVLEAIPLIKQFITTSTISGTWLPAIKKRITFKSQLSSFLTTHPEWFVNYPEFTELQKQLSLSPEVNLAVPLLSKFQDDDDKKNMVDEWLPAIKEEINNSFRG